MKRFATFLLISTLVMVTAVSMTPSSAQAAQITVIYGHSNCRSGYIKNKKTFSNVSLIQTLSTQLVPIPKGFGGIEIPLAQELERSGQHYLYPVCVAAATFQSGLPGPPVWGHPDFGPLNLRPYVLDWTLVPFLAAHPEVTSVVFLYLEATADAVAASQGVISDLTGLANAYTDLANASRAAVPAALPVKHVTILMDGAYSDSNPLAKWAPEVVAAQKLFISGVGGASVSFQGMTFPDGTHYDIPTFLKYVTLRVVPEIY